MILGEAGELFLETELFLEAEPVRLVRLLTGGAGEALLFSALRLLLGTFGGIADTTRSPFSVVVSVVTLMPTVFD